jgi:hypothetical protein
MAWLAGVEKVSGCTPAAPTWASSSAWHAGVEKAPGADRGVEKALGCTPVGLIGHLLWRGSREWRKRRVHVGIPDIGVIFDAARGVDLKKQEMTAGGPVPHGHSLHKKCKPKL